MRQLVSAIEAYNQAYGHMPVSASVQQAAKAGDFSYGAIIKTPDGTMPMGTMAGGQIIFNSEVIAILMDLTNYPGDIHRSTVNTNHCLNPRQTIFLNARFTADATSSGVGPDLVYRDPWGTPYFITLDLNRDGRCEDGHYHRRIVSQMNGTNGYAGMLNTNDPGGNGNHFRYPGQVLVWCAGRDRKINPGVPANQGENKDNILSWQ